MASDVRDNTERSRFELDIGGQVTFADYRRDGETLVIRHVEAPPALRGTGAADRLMQGVVELARAQGLKLQPRCGYAVSWLRRHNAAHDLLA